MSYAPRGLSLFGLTGVPLTSVAFGTAITYLVEPMLDAWTGITEIKYTTGGTQELLTVLRPLGFTHLAAAAAAGQKVVVLNADPGAYSAVKAFSTADDPIGASDYVCYQCPDGTYVMDTVASVAGLSITLTTTNLPLKLPAGTPFWFFGQPADTNPYDAKAHPTYSWFLSLTNQDLGNDEASSPWVQSYGTNNPLILYLNNVTATSSLERGTVIYHNRPGPYGNGPIPIPNG